MALGCIKEAAAAARGTRTHLLVLLLLLLLLVLPMVVVALLLLVPLLLLLPVVLLLLLPVIALLLLLVVAVLLLLLLAVVALLLVVVAALPLLSDHTPSSTALGAGGCTAWRRFSNSRADSGLNTHRNFLRTLPCNHLHCFARPTWAETLRFRAGLGGFAEGSWGLDLEGVGGEGVVGVGLKRGVRVGTCAGGVCKTFRYSCNKAGNKVL